MIRKRLLFIYTIVALMAFVNTPEIQSVPANPARFTMKQADGTSLTLTLHGDEHYRYYLTDDGYPLLPDDSGKLCYTYYSNGELKKSTFQAHEASLRSSEEAKFLSVIDKNATIAKMTAQKAETAGTVAQKGTALKTLPTGQMLIHEYPLSGSPKQLVLLIQFSDVQFSIDNPNEAFTNLTSQTGYSYNNATGCVLDYYKDQSNGVFTPEFDVVGPITLPHPEAYYGAASGSLVDANAWAMLPDACALVDDIVDFSQYDNNHDGYVDNIFVFYAGYAESNGASTNTIWPHSANIENYGLSAVHDGVRVNNYACTSELNGTTGTTRCGIGTFCHEYGHVLGLPDIYETNNAGAAFTPGYYELMDLGPYNNSGNTPPNMSVFDRMSLGWLNPVELTGAMDVVLKDISTNQGYVITTTSDNEFFLFENRQKKGWDTYIPGHGMLVWHIDYAADIWAKNSVNNVASHQRIDIVEADNAQSSYNTAGDPFPGTGNVTSFTDETTPKMVTWTGFAVGKPVTDIYEKDGIITFKVLGGGAQPDPVTATAATDITATSFIANWNTNVGIQTYEVDLCRPGSAVPLQTVTTGDVNSYSFTGLTPLTAYTYKVRAVSANVRSDDSNVIEVTTGAPTFDMYSVTALPASNISGNGFTARWAALDNAQSYELNVYEKEIGDPEHSIADFTGSVAGLPAGWVTTASQTYSLAGTYGAAKPSLKMTTTDDIVSPIFAETVRNFSFWYRGRGTGFAADNSIKIEGYRNSKWEQIDVITDISTTAGTTYNIGEGYEKELADGFYGIRLTYTATDGNFLALDDINIGYGGVRNKVYVSDFNAKNVGNVTSQAVSGLKTATTYYYTVKATDGTLVSGISDEVSVLTGTSGIETTAAAADGVTISASGTSVVVSNATAAVKTVAVYNTLGQLLKIADVESAGSVAIELQSGAVYVVACNGVVRKVVL